MGYADEYKGYMHYDPILEKIRVSRNIVFDKMNFGVQVPSSEKPVSSYDPWISSSLLYNSSYSVVEPPNSLPLPTQLDDGMALAPHPTNLPSSRFSSLVYCHCVSFDYTPIVPRRSVGIHHPLDRWIGYDNFTSDYKLFMANLVKDVEPSSYHQTSTLPIWIEAMNDEITALHECHI